MSNTPQIDDGGPAFPVPPGVTTFTGDPRDGAGYEPSQSGMTLRDHYAGLAMPTFLRILNMPGASLYGIDADNILQRAAAGAFRLADAMIAARKS